MLLQACWKEHWINSALYSTQETFKVGCFFIIFFKVDAAAENIHMYSVVMLKRQTRKSVMGNV